MKILYIHQYFKTLEESGSTRSFHLAKSFAEAGNEVVILASNTSDKEITKNCKLINIPVKYYNSMGILKRIWAFMKFAFLARKKAKQLGDFDLCYASSTPLTVGLIALNLLKTKQLPYIFEVRDLWPQFPIEMSGIRNKFVKSYLYGLEKKIYQNAKAIVALSPGMVQGIEKYKLEKPIYLIPNFADLNVFYPQKNPSERKKYLQENEFGIVHFGAIGKANHLEYLLDVAQESLKENLPLKYFILGEGSEKKRLQKLAQSKDLSNIFFLKSLPKKEIPLFISQMDFSYISFKDLPVLKTNSPNKLFDSMACGIIPIVNTDGWLKEIVEQNNCGFYANPHQPKEFLSKIKPYLKDQSLLEESSKNTLKLAQNEYNAKIQSQKLCTFLFENKTKAI